MIFFAILLIVIVIICVTIYAKRDPISRKKIEYKCDFDKTFIEPNEVFKLNTEIENGSTHPMRRVYVRYQMHPAMRLVYEPKYKSQILKNGNKQIICRTHIKSKSTRSLSTKLTVSRRGVYGTNEIGIDYVESMGFYSAYFNEAVSRKIVVAPKHVDDGFLSELITSGYGDYNAKRGFIEDETSISTYAEYTGHEPMRQISWKKTAQEGTLMVKKFEPMGSHVTTIVLDVNGFANVKFGTRNYDLIEYAISMIREIFEYYEKKRISYRFYTNAKSSFIDNHTFVSIPSGKMTKLRMLTMLGELKYDLKPSETVSTERLLDFAIKNSYKGPFVYVAPINRQVINYKLKKISKSKGMEIIELYSEQYCKQKTGEKNAIKT